MLIKLGESLLINRGLYDTEFEVTESSNIIVEGTPIAVRTLGSIISTLANKAL